MTGPVRSNTAHLSAVERQAYDAALRRISTSSLGSRPSDGSRGPSPTGRLESSVASGVCS